MKIHFIDTKSILLSFAVCGIHRYSLEPKQETRSHKKITCKNCKKALKARVN